MTITLSMDEVIKIVRDYLDKEGIDVTDASGTVAKVYDTYEEAHKAVGIEFQMCGPA